MATVLLVSCALTGCSHGGAGLQGVAWRLGSLALAPTCSHPLPDWGPQAPPHFLPPSPLALVTMSGSWGAPAFPLPPGWLEPAFLPPLLLLPTEGELCTAVA